MHLLHKYVRGEDDEQWFISCTECEYRKMLASKVTDYRVWDDTVDPAGWTYYTETNVPAPRLWYEYPES